MATEQKAPEFFVTPEGKKIPVDEFMKQLAAMRKATPPPLLSADEAAFLRAAVRFINSNQDASVNDPGQIFRLRHIASVVEFDEERAKTVIESLTRKGCFFVIAPDIAVMNGIGMEWYNSQFLSNGVQQMMDNRLSLAVEIHKRAKGRANVPVNAINIGKEMGLAPQRIADAIGFNQNNKVFAKGVIDEAGSVMLTEKGVADAEAETERVRKQAEAEAAEAAKKRRWYRVSWKSIATPFLAVAGAGRRNRGNRVLRRQDHSLVLSLAMTSTGEKAERL